MVAIVDFSTIIFVIMLVSNIMLCIIKIPILGFGFGFLTVVITGNVFMNNPLINVYFSYLLITIAFMSIIINGLEVISNKKRKK